MNYSIYNRNKTYTVANYQTNTINALIFPQVKLGGLETKTLDTKTKRNELLIELSKIRRYIE